MTNAQLLKPRYKAIAIYPASHYAVGEIIEPAAPVVGEFFFEKYPHLFKKLVWFQERDLKDLPLYVRVHKYVFKVTEWRRYTDGLPRLYNEYPVLESLDEQMWWQDFKQDSLPATEEEYFSYENRP